MKSLEKLSAKHPLLYVKTKKYRMNKNQLKKIIKKALILKKLQILNPALGILWRI